MSETKIFAIADLHLSNVSFDKYNMAKYGWHNHPQSLFDEWNKTVSDNDIVLLPGDISLELEKENTLIDLEIVDNLPGKQKIMIKGNHDKGFSRTLGGWQKQCASFSSLSVIQANAVKNDLLVVCGAKGTYGSNDRLFSYNYDDGLYNENKEKHHQKLLLKETGRLQRSLEEAFKIKENQKVVVMMHYPPFDNCDEPNEFTEIIKEYNVNICLYGHIHTEKEHNKAFQGNINGCQYVLVSADYLNQKPLQIM